MRIERELMRGAGPVAVLKLLEGGEKYGYELVDALARASDGVLAMGQSTLYPLLYNLEAQGLVRAQWRENEGPRPRKYYSLTGKGKKRLAGDTAQWRAVTVAMQELGVLNPKLGGRHGVNETMPSSDESFTVPQASKYGRAFYTPVSDVFRGKVTARLDFRQELAAANLPGPLAQRVYDVVRGTRLWRSEKFAVARELTAHFQDGLASGRSVASLADEFGSPDTAAQLIRQSKRRCRPLWWQTWRVVRLVLFAMLSVAVLVYLWLAARFYLSRPDISHNYWMEINDARRVPDTERAWPLYREALFKLGRVQVDYDWLDRGPESANWAKARPLLAEHQESLKLIREASHLPQLGFLLGDEEDLAAARLAGDTMLFSQSEPLASENKELIGAFLNGPQAMRSVARLIALDARRAALDGDGATVVQDYTALIAMADQLFQPHAMLVEQLIGMAIFGMGMESLGRTLEQSPAVLSDQQLTELAHRIAAFEHGATKIDFSGEQMLFHDIMQRIYSDDGADNGHVTAAGMNVLLDCTDKLSPLLNLAGHSDPKKSPGWAGLELLLSPGVAAFVGSREDNQQLYDKLLAKSIAAHQCPAWTWNPKAFDLEMKTVFGADPGRTHYLPVSMLLPALEAVHTAAERTLQNRDGVLVAIALELWRRHHDAYPQSLAELVPSMLPTVPIDRYIGQPLRFTVRDGKAIVYSVGVDRNDDGGQPSDPWHWACSGSFGIPEPSAAARATELDDGDWILWPPVLEPEDAQ